MAVWSQPKFGDVVWCRFPYGDNPTTVRHPCLVLDIKLDPSGKTWVVIAGGSSCNKSGKWEKMPDESDFLLQGDQVSLAGLSHATAFHMQANSYDANGKLTAGTLLTLPYDKNFFMAVQPSMTPRAGRVDFADARTRQAFQQAATHANLKAQMALENLRFSKNSLPPIRS